MKFKLPGLFLAIFFSLSASIVATAEVSQASTPADLSKTIIVGVISGANKANFESQILPILKEQTKSCSVCEVRNFSAYDKEQNFDVKALPQQLEQAGSQASFLIVHWNARYHPEMEPVVESLKKLTAKGTIVVGATGVARNDENAMPLSKTVLAQVPDLLIIGELAERERLLTQAYYGPEMLTAIKPPKEYMGQGYSSIFFGSKLATQWQKKTADAWLDHFKTTKSKSRRLWPLLEDFFR